MNGSTPARARHRTPSLWSAAAAGERVLIPLGVFWKADSAHLHSDYRGGEREGGWAVGRGHQLFAFDNGIQCQLNNAPLAREGRNGRERHANEEHLGKGEVPILPSFSLRKYLFHLRFFNEGD